MTDREPSEAMKPAQRDPVGLREAVARAIANYSHRAYIAALHAFYERRDGPNGFLGGRGQ